MTILKFKTFAHSSEFKKIGNFLQSSATDDLSSGISNDVCGFLEVIALRIL